MDDEPRCAACGARELEPHAADCPLRDIPPEELGNVVDLMRAVPGLTPSQALGQLYTADRRLHGRPE